MINLLASGSTNSRSIAKGNSLSGVIQAASASMGPSPNSQETRTRTRLAAVGPTLLTVPRSCFPVPDASTIHTGSQAAQALRP